MQFLEKNPKGSWEGDHEGGLLSKSSPSADRSIDEYVSMPGGYNTRVLAFFYDKNDYTDEIKHLKVIALKNSSRMNLRIALVTDTHLIKKMKKMHGNLFYDIGMSVMVLRRYDGELVKLDLSAGSDIGYNYWINAKSTRPVDKLTTASYQLTELAAMPMLVLFLDFNSPDPAVSKASNDLMKTMASVAPMFEHVFKVYWTD